MNAHLPQWITVLASALVLVAQVAAVQGQSTPAPATQAAATPEAAATPQAAAAFSKEQLEQIVAPIALHPDPLIAQMLMAATYPLEIVEAGRWLKANPGLKDKALEEALKTQDWDASVKSLCGFPDVLKQMDDNLDWTQDLGDAFLAQKTELMDTIQRMRGKAYDSGNLKTTEQQVVTQQPDKIIVVQPADPEVIYVPTYSPTVVYGGWSYPTYYYPPMYYPPPYGYGAMAFTVGVMWGAAIWGGCNWGWGGSDVDIDINRQNNFNRNTNIDGGRNQVSNRAGGKQSWQHDASHRGGVNYRDSKTAQQFGANSGSNRVSRDQARGYDRGGAGNSSIGQRPSASTGAAGSRDLGASNRDVGSSSRNAGASTRDVGASSRGGSGNSAFSGSRNSSMDRSASSRGGMSRGGGMSRSGGMSRGGGVRRR
jgi:hypothetical protein